MGAVSTCSGPTARLWLAVGTDGVGCECGELRFEFGAKAAVYHRPDAAVADGQRLFPILRRTIIPKQESRIGRIGGAGTG